VGAHQGGHRFSGSGISGATIGEVIGDDEALYESSSASHGARSDYHSTTSAQLTSALTIATYVTYV
jgi:hypothetical protein